MYLKDIFQIQYLNLKKKPIVILMRLLVIDEINLLLSVYPNEIGSFFKYVNKNYPLSIYPKQIFSFSRNINDVYSLSEIYQIWRI